MKASLLTGLNKFEVKNIDIIDPKENEVQIQVMAAGTCGSDSHKMKSGWKYGYPSVMGHEFSGKVVKLGTGVTDVAVNERVAVAPFIPCYHCYYCKVGMFQMCESYSMLGQQENGGFEQFVNVPARNVLNIGNMKYEDGALIEPMAVAAHAVFGIHAEIGDSVAVFGLGTVGDLVVRLLKIAGVKDIIGIDIDDQKLQKGVEEGCTQVINSSKVDLLEAVKKITDGRGVDITMECAGSKVTEEQALMITSRRGKIGYVGIAYADVTLRQQAFESIFRHELTLKGFWNSYSAPFPGREWTTMIDFVSAGKIKVSDLITHKYTLNQMQAAFDMITTRSESYNKVMFYPNGIENGEK
ncbi:galactitol-1-phosphate 5-dehydrogenase [Lactiplantibacillus plantarum]|uniref:Galactitol-1-phosphate 5-dehydrogenase n=1 Tax=Lactiplantibacillus plantarum CMPG5300 TaxID=1304889 RepID=A0AAW3FJ96_LACPN|nr:galactitol-1-phosphate 5-dehydrogenase [Lactiplantibacillus plantarum]APP12578.1 galactitol-1-phosphate 5-dehydrogenase [Lactiplantibacillus plantarum subsp. plantarum]ARO01947.1 galactitol-1-phosphate 5-dehydrogenase [Lactiplantibacillus plantarum]ARO04854.1 galactitol-1-phosphate 5-dehydrogenase [Lactiplantibacillus plantarum]ATI72757.1 galactitol-1-phosphate 5-dehydrogenase [Lactiplantibacillus plantarum]KGH41437.1 Galactitol-1-phosphate 5-dehydrogenase [Lactiplantibacillus plantarum CMP